MDLLWATSVLVLFRQGPLGCGCLRGIWGWSGFRGITYSGKYLISIFQGFSASIGGALVLAVGWGGGVGAGRGAIILWGLGSFLMSPNFLRSQF